MNEGKYANAPKETPLELQTAKLPILITTYPENGCYVLMMEYDKSRYCKRDMETLLSCMANCASSMAKAQRIRDISFLSDEEKSGDITDFSG